MSTKISDAELEIMRVLWREGRSLSFAEIRREMESKTAWSKSTIQTLVVRLRDKGVISAENHYVTLYSANVAEEDYLHEQGKDFINRLFEGNAKRLVAALCQSGQLGEDDIDELKEFFRMESDKK